METRIAVAQLAAAKALTATLCLKTSDLPRWLIDSLLPREAVHTAFVDDEGQGVALTDYRIALWGP